jgi:hypothetical protein
MKYILNSQICYLKPLRCVCLGLITAALSFAGDSAPTAYTLMVAVKTGDTICGKTITGFALPSVGANPPAIDESGAVAFYATYSEGDQVGEGIFTPTSLILKTGDTVGGYALQGISFVPALNDRGTVAVRGLSSSQAAILTPTALLVKTGDTISGQTLSSLGIPAMNNKGTVAFVGSSSSGDGIFTQTAQLARTGVPIGGQIPVTFGQPAINEGEMVAFQSWFAGGIATGILTPTSLLVKTGDTIGGKTLTDLFFGPALNSNGTIAFVGTFSGGTGIFTQKNLLVEAGDKIGGKTLTSFGYPMISDNGVVAFFATYAGGEGIFTQEAAIAKTGETICGKTLVGVGQPVISKHGIVAFLALFSDRSSAIVLAQGNTGLLEKSSHTVRPDFTCPLD